jgi:F-type H+-transporting ATPase subunit alpha
MSDETRHLPIDNWLDALYERADRLDEEVKLKQTALIKRLSDRAASRVSSSKPSSLVGPLVDILGHRTQEMESQVRFQEVGTVQHIGDGVARLSGLPHAATDELVTFPTGVQGLILNLDHHHVDVIMLGSEEGIQGGDLVTSSGRRLKVPVGNALLGRVVNPLGHPMDERGAIRAGEFRHLEQDAPGIVAREPVKEPLHTGLKIIDALVPIGRGQRELIVGDRQTGKTTIAVDAILNQRDQDVACVYVAIGQKKSSVLRVIETLRRYDALPYTTVVVSGPDDPPALRYLAPYAGCTMGEHLMAQGRDVLVVYDDLSRHADAYRELSLLLRRPPGREAYPGDIFYLHARLLERACKLSAESGGGSLTALPIVQMQRGNLSAYIPTNLISITDGQIVLDTELFNQSVQPAVDVGQSVSRVGGAAQTEAMKSVTGELKLELSQFEEVERFSRFGTEVGESTRRQIQRGERLRAALKQPAHQPLPLTDQILILRAATEGYLDDLAPEDVPAFERALRQRFQEEHPGTFQHINHQGEITEEAEQIIHNTIVRQHNAWLERKSGHL